MSLSDRLNRNYICLSSFCRQTVPHSSDRSGKGPVPGTVVEVHPRVGLIRVRVRVRVRVRPAGELLRQRPYPRSSWRCQCKFTRFHSSALS